MAAPVEVDGPAGTGLHGAHDPISGRVLYKDRRGSVPGVCAGRGHPGYGVLGMRARCSVGRSVGFGLGLWVGLGAAAVPALAKASPGEALARLRAASPGTVSARTDPGRGIVRFVRTPAGVPGLSAGATPMRDASAFLSRFGGLFGLGHPGVSLHPRSVSTDALGHRHAELQQRYLGLPVFGTSVRVHWDAAGRLVAAQAAIVPVVDVSTAPSFAEAEAAAIAIDHEGGVGWAATIELLVFDLGLVTKGLSDPRLAYAVEVEGPGRHATVFVDAHDGAVLLEASHVHDVLTRAVYDSGYGPGFLVWQESDGPYTGGVADVEALIGYTQDTYELFQNVSGGAYPSFDGASAPMEGVLDAPIECPNANWDGTTTNFCDGLVTDDVVAHEWAHAYSANNHAPIYAYQPGALNEAYSDIFGESIDLLNGAGLDSPGEPRPANSCSGGGDSVRWLIGEETEGFGGAIRDMWTPTCMGGPGRVGDGEYLCIGPDRFFDNGGVHINSGVPNHAYALLVDGGSYNGELVPAIGFDKALAIYWRAMTVYQGVVSGFADHADALEASCTDLVGIELPSVVDGAPSGEAISASDCAAVASAIAATEMQDDPGCGSGTLFDPGAAPDACGAAARSVIFSETFEADLAAWTLENQGVAAGYEPRDWLVASDLPDGRAGQAAFANGDLYLGDCNGDDQSGVMWMASPEIAIGPGDGPVVLEFSHWLASEPPVDGGNLQISIDGQPFQAIPGSAFTFNAYNATLDDTSNPLAGQAAFSGSDPGVPTGTWVVSQVDLSGLVAPGDTIAIRFAFGVNECNGLFGWWVDDVQVMQCGADGGDTGSDTGTSSGGGDTTGASTIGDASTGSPGEGDTAGSSTTASEPPSGDGTSGDGDTTGGPAQESGDDGCGCTSGDAGRRSVPWWMLLVLGVARRRRQLSRV
jgi:bacillolysin